MTQPTCDECPGKEPATHRLSFSWNGEDTEQMDLCAYHFKQTIRDWPDTPSHEVWSDDQWMHPEDAAHAD